MIELNGQSIAFFVFSLLTLGGALGVVTSRNLIHGALYLILSLFGGAGLFVLLSAPFMAAVQVIVYIGAIAILIIFAVMLTRSMTAMREVFNQQWWISAIAAALFFVLLMIGVILPVWGENGLLGDAAGQRSGDHGRRLGHRLCRWERLRLAFRGRLAAADRRHHRRHRAGARYRMMLRTRLLSQEGTAR